MRYKEYDVILLIHCAVLSYELQITSTDQADLFPLRLLKRLRPLERFVHMFRKLEGFPSSTNTIGEKMYNMPLLIVPLFCTGMVSSSDAIYGSIAKWGFFLSFSTSGERAKLHREYVESMAFIR